MKTSKYIILLGILLFGANQSFAQNVEKSKVKINNLKLVNSSALEFSPAYYKDDLIFVSNNPIQGKKKVFDKKLKLPAMSLFITKKDRKGYYHKPEPFDSAFLSKVHEGPITYDSQNEVIYFTRNDNKDNGAKPRYVGNTNYMKIYAATYNSEDWSTPELMPLNDEKSDACHPSISLDGEKLYFASNRAGGLGGMDLYMCKKVDGAWSEPVNLGDEVNSAQNDVFPFIHEDGTLYFSSNRPKGLGGLDIYYTRIDTTSSYIKPISLGKPFNTDKDDFGFIVDKENKTGFLASNRGGGMGGDDIYSFAIPENTKPFSDVKLLSDTYKTQENGKNERLITVFVLDRKSGLPLSKAYVCITSTGRQKPAVETAGDNCFTMITDENGKAVLHVSLNNNYFVRINKTDFKPNQMTIMMNDSHNEAIVLLDQIGDTPLATVNGGGEEDPTGSNNVKKTKNDRIYQLRNIYYDYNEASIRFDASVVLDSLVQILFEFPNMEVELAAHTDSRGNVPYNINLSKRRANSVIDYLVSKGIKRRRLNAIGYGKQQLSNECGDGVPCPPEKHQDNRRTEIRILKSFGTEWEICNNG